MFHGGWTWTYNTAASPAQTPSACPWTSDGKVKEANLKLVCVPVSFDLITEMVTRGYKTNGLETIEGVPPGAVCLGSFSDDNRHEACLVFEHDSFGVVPMGDFIPTIRIVIRKVSP